MSTLTPLEPLYECRSDGAIEMPLPDDLEELYGRLAFPAHPGRPYLIGNFVSTLDGVVSLNAPGKSGGDVISGFNPHDQMVMGLLRAAADAVIVGAGSLQSAHGHIWTPGFIYPAMANSYQALRQNLGKFGPPLNVVVTASGAISLNQRVFETGEVPAVIVTTAQGAHDLRTREMPPAIRIEVAEGTQDISSQAILDAISRVRHSDLILVEGGPHLMGSLMADGALDELFLTLAPQVAGRDGSAERPGFVAGQSFAPELPLWGKLSSIKRGHSHLFLRYTFEPPG